METSKNEDRTRVKDFLVISLVCGWFIVMLLPLMVREYHRYSDEEPWMQVDLAFSAETGNDGWPIIDYSRIIKKNVTGEWFAWVDTKTPSGVISRICGGSGIHVYDPRDTGTLQMTTTYFIGSDCRGQRPPMTEYRICVRSILSDDNGLQSKIGPSCTEFKQGETQT